MSNEKVSVITLRLTAEEAAQLEILKSITGKRSDKVRRQRVSTFLCSLQARST